MSGVRAIEVPGLNHGNQPFPIAALRGPFLSTSGINGLDPSTGTVPDDPEAQIAQAFANVRAVLAAAGGSLADITLVQVSLSDLSLRTTVNRYWTEAFPDPAARPARNTVQRPLGGNTVCNLLVTAYLEDR